MKRFPKQNAKNNIKQHTNRKYANPSIKNSRLVYGCRVEMVEHDKIEEELLKSC